MTEPRTDRAFTGSIPEVYESLLVPLIFEPYAVDLARRVAALAPGRVLEVAAGTGVVTRHLAADLPAASEIVATDLNPPMLARAQAAGTARPVEWRPADAQQLPFDDASFDVVVCQFGVMFFPDRAQAHAEARRVLRPGGMLFFVVWDRIEENEFPDEVTRAVSALFPGAATRFLARVPHGYHDLAKIRSDLAAGGFAAVPTTETVAARSRAASAEIAARAFCTGTPLRNEIEAIDPARLEEAVAAAAAALVARFGAGPVEGRIQAHVVTVER